MNMEDIMAKNYVEELPKILWGVPFVFDMKIKYELQGEYWEVNVYHCEVPKQGKPLTEWIPFRASTMNEASKRVCDWVERQKEARKSQFNDSLI